MPRSSIIDSNTPETDWAGERIGANRHMVRDLEGLWESILKLAAVVEIQLKTAVQALCEGHLDLAARVKLDEHGINLWEVRIEQECLKILALHQPVASDLRRVAGIMKINGDLERMADLADHIANRARKLIAADRQPIPVPHLLEEMAAAALAEVHVSFDALAQCNSELARSVIDGDRGVDRLRRDVVRELKAAILGDPERLSSWLRLINCARNLERISDHATNIAEAVVYIKEGLIIRHAVDRRVEPAAE
jgi:phosphate transport system protein